MAERTSEIKGPGESTQTSPVGRRILMRPLLVSGGLTLAAGLLCLIALVYLSHASAQRLDPLAMHLAHLRNLQTVSLEVQNALTRDIEGDNPPDRKSIEKISVDLRNMLRGRGYLHKATPGRILAAQNLLLRDGHSMRDNLGAAFDVLQRTVRDENQVQEGVIVKSRQTADREFLMAMFALAAVPITLIILLLLFRRSLFAWTASLSEMLENVRQSNLDPVRLPDKGNAIYPVIESYNAMVGRLTEIEAEHADKEQDLEHQVQVASEGLMRLQRSLAHAEQLSAIGEFSARVAHELRNPLSGIAVALRNLRRDLTVEDQKEVTDLVLNEIERIDRLLTSLLERTPRERERAVPTRIAGLCRDMISLFGFESEAPIDYRVDVEDCECKLPRDSLRQALLNILRNSAQAMGRRGGSIEISGKRDHDRFVLAIQDSGPGYPEDLLRHGIRPFRSDKAGGSGLGLSVIQRLIADAGGQLHLENAESGGARTVIELPLRENAE